MKHLLLIFVLFLTCQVFTCCAQADTVKQDRKSYLFSFVKMVSDGKEYLIEGAYTWTMYLDRNAISFKQSENDKTSSFYFRLKGVEAFEDGIMYILDSPVFSSLTTEPYNDPTSETVEYYIWMKFKTGDKSWYFKPVFERDWNYPDKVVPKLKTP